MSTPPQVIEELRQLPQDKPLLCQVVDQCGNAWNMHFDFHTVGSFNVLRISHPDLKELPAIVFGAGQPYPAA